jgi:hypothetical protein
MGIGRLTKSLLPTSDSVPHADQLLPGEPQVNVSKAQGVETRTLSLVT